LHGENDVSYFDKYDDSMRVQEHVEPEDDPYKDWWVIDIYINIPVVIVIVIVIYIYMFMIIIYLVTNNG
jgi:hypothetical protein